MAAPDDLADLAIRHLVDPPLIAGPRASSEVGIVVVMQGLVLLDDGRGSFGPMVDLRATFDIRSGWLTTAERIAAASRLELAAVIVPAALAGIAAEERPGVAVNAVPSGEGPWLVVNGRLLQPPSGVGLEPGTAEIDPADGSIRRAVLDAAALAAVIESGELPESVRRVERSEPPLAMAPWDIFTTAGARLAGDLSLAGESGMLAEDAWMRLHGGTVVGDHPVRIHRAAVIDPGVVLDAREGPIVVGEGAHLGVHAVLHGPVAVMNGTRIADHATLKANTILGPGCRVGGEVGGTVIQGFSNKSHDGHLGDSWVGSWVNLGAATVNSNLLNTYGEVVMRLEPDGPRLRSDRQFLGCVLGDHVKTAIGTRIMTGTAIGTGAMIATSTPPPSTVARFAWHTDEGTRRYRLEKFLDTARLVMVRRDRTLGSAAEARLRELHAAGEPESAS
jgi:UDP-N-acetylglucosamine diphosphorylase/glucosamine-1-phosphate N-acetyltransferase